jgi:hypothetical protein
VHHRRGPGRELLKVRGIGSDRGVGIAHRLEVGRRRQAVLAERSALPAWGAVGVRRGDGYLADPGGGRERDRVGDDAAEAEAEEVGFADAQVVEQRDNVAGQGLDRHLAASVGGVAVALQLDRDHLPVLGQGAEQGPEVKVDGQQAPVKQHERTPAAAGFVVQLQAVHRCVRHVRDD